MKLKTALIAAAAALCTAAIMTFTYSSPVSIGVIGSVDAGTGEVIVNIPGSSGMVTIGDLLFVQVNGEVVVLRATFPMQTMSKCKLLPGHKKYFSKLTRGMPVYRYYSGVEKKGEEAAVIDGYAGEIRKIGGMEFVYVPAGTFIMGSPDGEGDKDEHPAHKVTVDGFWMGRCEVTQRQYKTVTGNNPARFKGRPDNPVEQVSWFDARDFCDSFGDMNGVTARLPFEAEWEYAARGGSAARYYWGDSAEPGVAGRYAVYDNNSYAMGEKNPAYGTHKTGTKVRNGFGLYDMSGNVFEFCRDWYDDPGKKNYYAKSPEKNPNGVLNGTTRVLRGGSWNSDAGVLRSANRSFAAPHNVSEYNGFRVVIVPAR